METIETRVFRPAQALLASGIDLARQCRAKALLVSMEALPDHMLLKTVQLEGCELIPVARIKDHLKFIEELGLRNIQIPHVNLSRMGQIKTAIILAFSQRLLDTGDNVVFLVGPIGGEIDTLMLMRVGEEWEMFRTTNQPRLTEHIKRVVFQQTLTIALELASEGREGKPVGALFIIGDYRNIIPHRQQIILNPFKGYSEKTRNILDESMRDTIKSFATLDGAFIIKGNGTLASAGTHIRGVKPSQPLPPGLGARHAAAAGITSVCKCIAVTISESTGTVRIWRKGQIITEIERLTPHTRHGQVLSTE
jgi:DNA integrity scanning protein DisA with diadenylate cyclase activity